MMQGMILQQMLFIQLFRASQEGIEFLSLMPQNVHTLGKTRNTCIMHSIQQ